ncbi:L,D-transpeptidase [Polymorphum gilvum]|uniref:ErfK/YbiS/YcfS/YnhG superfamily n=1 Tax=Polymorphum gilvum (strain LMG 25793 / CGMCC 1.9160 / SL003B-26A1) TaxID=991905 RepID=F2J4Y4_POLGS|nr:L,D-transpeptidase [Polymorphum gilvum]ADZ70026.1 ErfK/YbiS/YcfS/YnhG superfamily [Polymorphum gilvum SL003B-26A1]
MGRVFGRFLALLAVAGSMGFGGPHVQAAPDLVAFKDPRFRPGTVVIKNSERRLYLVLGRGQALRYPVAVGQRGKSWTGQTYIDGKYVKPAWSPPAVVKRDFPDLPDVIAGGAPNNPMGVAALTLAGDDYAIHGTNRPGSIGRAVSYGCIRMRNGDILDLFNRVGLNTPVVAVN